MAEADDDNVDEEDDEANDANDAKDDDDANDGDDANDDVDDADVIVDKWFRSKWSWAGENLVHAGESFR